VCIYILDPKQSLNRVKSSTFSISKTIENHYFISLSHNHSLFLFKLSPLLGSQPIIATLFPLSQKDSPFFFSQNHYFQHIHTFSFSSSLFSFYSTFLFILLTTHFILGFKASIFSQAF